MLRGSVQLRKPVDPSLDSLPSADPLPHLRASLVHKDQPQHSKHTTFTSVSCCTDVHASLHDCCTNCTQLAV